MSATSATGIAAKMTVEEIQVLSLGNGQDSQNAAQVWKLYYKGEESQNMDFQSTTAQIAEEIDSFSALSGPVTVSSEGTGTTGTTGFPRYVVTFSAQDGDVAEMTADTTDVTIVTRANGWSIETPLGFGLDTMQAGGIINVTAQEVCTFTFTLAGHATDIGSGYYCYDGICGSDVSGPTAGAAETAIESIKDDTGVALLAIATPGLADINNADADDGTTKDSFVVTMPMGKSCDGLELRGTSVAVTKTVDKNNNGKQFKITRSFLQKTAVAKASGIAGTAAITCDAGSCLGAVEGVDSIVIGGSSCTAKANADGHAYPILRTAGTVAHPTGAVSTVDVSSAVVASTACDSIYIARHVMTLDSMPTSSGTTAGKAFKYTSSVGSCSVSETTKGTYESYECSNRGACDGKSGLCTCYEGYSGQSCQTQTVLV